MKKILYCLGICILLFSSCAQQELNVFGSVTGIVKDAQTSNPLSGVKVTVTYTGASQITTSEGQFMFDNLDAQEYTLTFEKSGYMTTTQTVKVLAGETVSVHVQMQKNTLPIDVSPTFLNFGTNESSLNLTLTATDNQSVMFTTSTSDNWLSVTPQSGTVNSSSPTTLHVMVSRTLSAGSYEGILTIRVNSESKTIPVYMQVAGANVPVVSVESVTGITQTTATVKGLLTVEDGLSVSDYGVCYSINTLPTVNDQKASRGGCSKSTDFTCQLSGLTPGIAYNVRAYAVCDGITYYGNTKSFTTATSGGGGSGTEDYSSAIVNSDNNQVAINLTSCRRTGTRVTIEATILNKGINPCDCYRMNTIGNGYTSGKITHYTYIEDDLYTDYSYNQLGFYLNNRSNIGGSMDTQLPVGSTKILKITIDGVPVLAKQISVYIATVFMGTSPTEYAFLTFKNVPIY